EEKRGTRGGTSGVWRFPTSADPGAAKPHVRCPAPSGCRVSFVAYEGIPIAPGRMGGLPCIRDRRVTVTAVLGQLAAGRTVDEVLADHPYLDRADVLAALEFAAAALQERELPLVSAA